MSEEKPIEKMSQGEAKVEIDRRLEDFESPYWQNDHPAHKRAVDEMRRLHEVAWPSKGPHDSMVEQLEREGVTEEDFKKAEKKLDDLRAEMEDEQEIPLTPEQEEGFKKLRGEWGNEFDARLEQARVTYQTVAESYAKNNPEFIELMESSVGNEPAIIKLFSDIGRELKEEAANMSCPHCGKRLSEKEEN